MCEIKSEKKKLWIEMAVNWATGNEHDDRAFENLDREMKLTVWKKRTTLEMDD